MANATVGRFLCFIKGDWDAGLKLLAASGTGELGELAIADLKGAEDATAKLSLADSWWRMAELAKTGCLPSRLSRSSVVLVSVRDFRVAELARSDARQGKTQ